MSVVVVKEVWCRPHPAQRVRRLILPGKEEGEEEEKEIEEGMKTVGYKVEVLSVSTSKIGVVEVEYLVFGLRSFDGSQSVT